ncbi:beta-mannosidase [Flavobacterium wongokense]|uniref:beta-mannosidase n=1 Tax=Flavobacterium wongokense TaxID=2910674 RepID=UPI001F32BA7F|nr:glycoside hydrolase family 2 protein [Flavobacterium sp. WG47]MCF6133302.1 glycoside hydrolase family 2 protein [Flavobacterium sp. WG47]
MKIKVLKSLLLLLLPFVFSAQNSQRSLSLEKWEFKSVTNDKYKWHPAKVPGTVHTDLLANKLIPEPFFGTNEKQLQWIENEDWEYQSSFSVSKDELNSEHSVLVFEGLDTYAEVFLNGTSILKADNMFRTWKVDVKNQLKYGKNELRIVFESAVKRGKEEAKKLSYVLPGDEKIFTRKAQYQYGWDWGPRFVTAGIWKDIQLHFWNAATISNLKYNQKALNDALAQLEFITTIETSQSGKFQLKINDRISDVNLRKGENTVMLSYAIQKPKRWWPNGLGEAHLYPFEISLIGNSQSIDKKNLNVGLRTIELVQEKDEIGKSFYFKVNGIPVFMKGANYIPPDSFLPRITDSDYKNIVKNAVDANMNMLRVWGGGVYADDAFYDECDQQGILVWQDFMFACAMYPGDPTFLDSVKNEIIDNVSRLQNHSCIALWCGNNEVDEGWHNWGWQKQYNYSAAQETSIWNDYRSLFQELIPQTLDGMLNRGENRYWPSSPSIGWGKEESLLEGDSHYWGVWWGMEPFEVYQKKVGRFMSEYGFQGMPNVETFTSFAHNKDLNLNSEAVKNHQKHASGYQTINEYMARDYKVPAKFEDYIYVSQLLQAKGMQTAMEAHRSAKPHCMGTLYWQLNDCWPVTSWSSVDYLGNWKALHYQAKKSYENLLIAVQEEKDAYRIQIINDDLKPYQGEMEMQLLNFNGKRLWNSEANIAVAENSSAEYYKISKADISAFDLKNAVLSIVFKSKDKSTNTLFYFAKPKELQLTKPKIQIKRIDALTIEISSDVLAKDVYLFSSHATFFSDNYFDVLPNQKLRISLSKAVEGIQAKSLFDTME